MTRKLAFATFAAALLPVVASASSDDAWEEFRLQIEESCRALVDEGAAESAAIEVNPFGSEHFGAAIVTLPGPDGQGDRMICIYDKQTGATELTGPFTPADDADDSDPDRI